MRMGRDLTALKKKSRPGGALPGAGRKDGRELEKGGLVLWPTPPYQQGQVVAMVEKVVSGGQTGADRAALDVALELKIPCGGWCPKGRKEEDRPIEPRYPLRETNAADYRVRSRKNVEDSDGPLILTRGPVTGGTALTIKLAREKGKPLLIIDLNQNPDPSMVQKWLKGENIRILNVAGPRESKMPGLHSHAVEFLRAVLKR